MPVTATRRVRAAGAFRLASRMRSLTAVMSQTDDEVNGSHGAVRDRRAGDEARKQIAEGKPRCARRLTPPLTRPARFHWLAFIGAKWTNLKPPFWTNFKPASTRRTAKRGIARTLPTNSVRCIVNDLRQTVTVYIFPPQENRRSHEWLKSEFRLAA